MMIESPHPTRKELAAFAGGFLSETDTESISSHLENCVQCENLLHDLPADGFLLQLRRLVRDAPPAALARSNDDCTPRPVRLLETVAWLPADSGSGQDVPHIHGYKTMAELGRGGMGIVYKAWQTDLERHVAVKVLNRGNDVEDLLRFRTEAQAVAQLQHPGIVQIYDLGEQDGQPYLCLEFVDGGNLGQRLAAGPLPAREAAEMSCTLAEAMHVVHQLGIIHRDLKPANILLSAGGQPKINDFGLAKRLDANLGHTLSGVIMGTPSYMAPEQARGLSKRATAAADVYSLGATLYEMLTGRPPFKAASQLDTLQQVLADDPVPPRRLQPTVPRDLETICLKCLDKAPARRYASAAELAADLRRFLDGVPIQARPSSRLERLVKWVRRRPATAALMGTIVIAVAITCGLVASMIYQAGLRSSLEEVSRQKDEVSRQKEEAQVQRNRAELLGAKLHYAVSLNAGQQAWNLGNVRTMHAILSRLRPKAGGPDLRGFEWFYLWGLCHGSDRFSLRGHKEAVRAVAYSHDGKWLASAGDDGIIRIWDPQTRQTLCTLSGRASAIRALAVSPKESLLASAAMDGSVTLWDVAQKRQQRTLAAHDGPVTALAFSPDGSVLASDGEDKTIALWKVAGNNQPTRLRGHTHKITALAIAPDGLALASASLDATVRLWDLAQGKQKGLLNLRRVYANALAFSPDGRNVAMGLYDARVAFWQPALRKGRFFPKGVHTDLVTSLAYAPDGKTLASGSADHTIRLWDIASGRSRSLRGHTGRVQTLSFAPDGRTLASGSSDGAVKLWPIDLEQEATTLRGHHDTVYTVKFDPTGKMLASAGVELPIRLWSLPAGSKQATLTARTGTVYTLAFDSHGKTFISGGASVAQSPDRLPHGEVRFWNLASRKQSRPAKEYPHQVLALALAPKARTLAVGLADGTVLLHHLDSHKDSRLGRLKGQVRSLAFSPNGKLLAAGGLDPAVHVCDMASGNEIATLRGHSGTIFGLAFAPDGRTLAAAGSDEDIRLWDVDGRRLRAALKGHTSVVLALTFTPDGRRLASAGADRTIRIWDPVNETELLVLSGHEDRIWSLDFSADGKTLASGGEDGLVKLWHGGEP